MKAYQYVLSIIILALLSNIMMANIVTFLPTFTVLWILISLIIISISLLIYIVLFARLGIFDKVSLMMVSLFSAGLMLVSYLVNAKHISISDIYYLEGSLVVILFVAMFSGFISYMRKD